MSQSLIKKNIRKGDWMSEFEITKFMDLQRNILTGVLVQSLNESFKMKKKGKYIKIVDVLEKITKKDISGMNKIELFNTMLKVSDFILDGWRSEVRGDIRDDKNIRKILHKRDSDWKMVMGEIVDFLERHNAKTVIDRGEENKEMIPKIDNMNYIG